MSYPETSAHAHYVSVINGKRSGLLLGPYPSRRDAEAHVDTARELAERIDPFAAFYGFGTARVTLRPGATAQPGRLNGYATRHGVAIGSIRTVGGSHA